MAKAYLPCSGTEPSPVRDEVSRWPRVDGEVPDESPTLPSDGAKPRGLHPGIAPIPVVDVDPEPPELPVPEAVPDVPEPRPHLDEGAAQSSRRRRGEGVHGPRYRERVVEEGLGVPVAAEHAVQHHDIGVRQWHLGTVADFEGRALRDPPPCGQAPSLVDGLGRQLDAERPDRSPPAGLDDQGAAPAPAPRSPRAAAITRSPIPPPTSRTVRSRMPASSIPRSNETVTPATVGFLFDRFDQWATHSSKQPSPSSSTTGRV